MPKKTQKPEKTRDNSRFSDSSGSGTPQNARKVVSGSFKIFKSIQKTKESSQSNLIWWISGVVGFVILLMVIGSGGNNSGTNANEYRANFSISKLCKHFKT